MRLLGSKLVNIREYYVDNNSGEEKPGAKGIALTEDQWKSLFVQINEIHDSISKSDDCVFPLCTNRLLISII